MKSTEVPLVAFSGLVSLMVSQSVKKLPYLTRLSDTVYLHTNSANSDCVQEIMADVAVTIEDGVIIGANALCYILLS